VRTQHLTAPLVVVGHFSVAVAAMLLELRDPRAADALVLSGGPLLRQEWIEAELSSGAAETEVTDPAEWMSTHPAYVDARR
jgi:hypothetical protein